MYLYGESNLIIFLMGGIMKKFDLITRPYDEFYDLMNQFFDRSVPLSKAFADIKVDVEEKDNEYIIEADMPGISKDDIHLDLEENYLQIEVKRRQEIKKEEKNYIRKERSFSSLKRSIYLANVQKEGIEARLENGVLMIRVPKKTKDQQKVGIEIK